MKNIKKIIAIIVLFILLLILVLTGQFDNDQYRDRSVREGAGVLNDSDLALLTETQTATDQVLQEIDALQQQLDQSILEYQYQQLPAVERESSPEQALNKPNKLAEKKTLAQNKIVEQERQTKEQFTHSKGDTKNTDAIDAEGFKEVKDEPLKASLLTKVKNFFLGETPKKRPSEINQATVEVASVSSEIDKLKVDKVKTSGPIIQQSDHRNHNVSHSEINNNASSKKRDFVDDNNLSDPIHLTQSTTALPVDVESVLIKNTIHDLELQKQQLEQLKQRTLSVLKVRKEAIFSQYEDKNTVTGAGLSNVLPQAGTNGSVGDSESLMASVNEARQENLSQDKTNAATKKNSDMAIDQVNNNDETLKLVKNAELTQISVESPAFSLEAIKAQLNKSKNNLAVIDTLVAQEKAIALAELNWAANKKQFKLSTPSSINVAQSAVVKALELKEAGLFAEAEATQQVALAAFSEARKQIQTDIQNYSQRMLAAEKKRKAQKAASIAAEKRRRLRGVLIDIPGGQFKMGSKTSPDEKPLHTVQIKPFKMHAYEVTWHQYQLCVNAKVCSSDGDEGWGKKDRPVIGVSWNDIQKYIQWLNVKTGDVYRLPTEAEWEYAARAGSKIAYSWGQSIGVNNANCDGCGSQWDNKKTAPVKSFKANAFGLYDMHGNVREWVQDCWYENYKRAPNDGRSRLGNDKTCNVRVMRGGSWFYSPVNVRAANRFNDVASSRHNYYGFRLAQDIKAK